MNERFPSEVFFAVAPRPEFVREADFVHVAIKTGFSLAVQRPNFSPPYFDGWRVFARFENYSMNTQ